MLQLGPDAPTLCAGWTTRDLAVHLLIRERKPLAAAGIVLPVARKRLEAETQRQLQRSFDEVVREWAAGPSRLSPFSLFDVPANTVEHFIHHEDVRRGGGEVVPRDFSRVVQRSFHKALQSFAPRFLAKSDAPVLLLPEGFERVVTADRRGVADQGSDVVRVTGDVGELLLWAYGRDAVHVKIEGDSAAVRRSSL